MTKKKLLFDDAINYLKDNYTEEYASRYGLKTKKGTLNKCLHPQHTDSDPSMGYIHDAKMFNCLGCGRKWGLFDLIGHFEKLGDDFKEQLKWACEEWNVEIVREGASTYKRPEKKEEEKQLKDYMDYFQKCKEKLQQEWSDDCYLAKRGLSKEICEKYYLGLEPRFKTKVDEEFVEWEAIIIPTSKGTYTARNTDFNASKNERYRNRGDSYLFNSKVLETATAPIFVVEGEIDCLSIIEAGGNAVGLGSTSNVELFLYEVEKSKTQQPFILCLDNDERGQEAQTKLQNGLMQLGKKQYELNPCGYSKDCNEALVYERTEFIQNIKGISVSPQVWKEREKNKTQHALDSVIKVLDQKEKPELVSTGFKGLDSMLNGGFKPELYILQAETGVGKSMLLQQIGDYVARHKRFVEFYNLEMGTDEMIARSIGRHIVENFLKGNVEGIKQNQLPTAIDILSGCKYDERLNETVSFTKEENECIAQAITDYAEYCNYLNYHESIGALDTEDIRKNAEYCLQMTGQAPLIIIDYLQMVAVGKISKATKSMTDLQAIDTVVLELKAISRAYKSPIIVVSSVNREASKMNAEHGLEAAKGSGTIEFTAGIGLDYDFEAKGQEGYSKETEKKRNPRQMRIKSLKNRHGRDRENVSLNFYPQFCFFEERSK